MPRGGNSNKALGVKDRPLYSAKQVRKWAKLNKIPCPAAGRIPVEIIKRYQREARLN